MAQQKVNKRGWVKNAAIIFLSVLLVLTFFSNTIANRYLPEVATQQVTAGTLSVQIRGQGTVVAAESFEVKSATSRKVLSVPVKVGDTVAVGDTLIIFSEAASDELKAAQDALDALTLAYQKALINSTDTDYTKENRDIQLAQQALDKAKAERDANYVSPDALAESRSYLDKAKTEVIIQQAKVNALQEQFNGMSPITGGNSAAINAKNAEIAKANNELSSAKLIHGVALGKLEDLANKWMTAKNLTTEEQKAQLSIYMSALANSFASQTNVENPPTSVSLPSDWPLPPSPPTVQDAKAMADAHAAILECEATLARLKAELSALQGSQTGDWNYESVRKQLNEAKNTLVMLQNMQTTAEAALENIESKHAKYTEAEAAVSSNQRTLEDLMFSLTEKKKADGKMQASEALDLESQRKQIDEKRAELEALQSGGEGSTVTSQVNGIVSAVSVSAGNTAAADSTLMMVEVPDLGYTLSFPVSTEQSQRVRIGESATILYNYWGANKTANLVAIATNPENPTTSKLLVFKLGGEIVSGEQLSISVGEKGSNYDAIIPNSAIRSDSNGDFVLAVEAKSSVFGNRFSAVRVDVKVLAKDDTHTAVTGGIGVGDYVVTHSSKPIESGMRIRLPD